jgi:hypothetical protein
MSEVLTVGRDLNTGVIATNRARTSPRIHYILLVASDRSQVEAQLRRSGSAS